MTPPSPAGNLSASGREDALVPIRHPQRHRRDGSIASATVNGLPPTAPLYVDAARTSRSHRAPRCRPAPTRRLTVHFQPTPDWNGDTVSVLGHR